MSEEKLPLGKTHSSIETTVTKLLMSTKLLLQTLTQWSRGSVGPRAVSDAYVHLGNDFKIVSKFFTHAKVDISDLGDVPLALRKVLEVALREPPSDESLNKYLPQIREIIVTLLDKLKVKQALLKTMKQEQKMMMTSPQHRKQHSITSSISLESERGGVSTAGSRVNSIVSNVQSLRNSATVDQQFVDADTESTTTSAGLTSVTAVEDSQPEEGDALAQLKKGNNLQRKASKRYSAYHMAKLTNHSATEAANAAALASNGLPQSLDNDLSSERIISQDSKRLSSTGNKLTERLQNELEDKHEDEINPEAVQISDINKVEAMKQVEATDKAEAKGVLFLKLDDRVKKCEATFPITMTGLRLLFVEMFAYSPGGDSFPDIYINDPVHNISYELDEHGLKEVKEGSLVELHSRPTQAPPSSAGSDLIDLLKDELQKNQQVMLDRISSLQINSAPVQASSSEKENVATNKEYSNTLKEVQHEIAIVRQVYIDNKKALEKTIKFILEKVDAFKSVNLATNNSSNRQYIEQSQTELGDVSDKLLSKVDDLQDLIEIIRKDVAERGAQPSKRKLELVQKELNDAEHDLQRMKSFIDTEKPHWKKIWETELDKVCEEQQFLTLQEDLIVDLKEDLKKAVETFDLIDQCCKEQEKTPAKPRRNPVLPLLKPGTFNQVREEMLMAVQQLNPDHESRVEALERAEKIWERERGYRDEDEFRDELGNFVENSNLKKSGGVEEVERRRREKDEENLRANFGGGQLL